MQGAHPSNLDSARAHDCQMVKGQIDFGMQVRDAANMVAIRRAIAKCAFARAEPSNPVRTLEGK
jgi:hypothetical protein